MRIEIAPSTCRVGNLLSKSRTESHPPIEPLLSSSGETPVSNLITFNFKIMETLKKDLSAIKSGKALKEYAIANGIEIPEVADDLKGAELANIIKTIIDENDAQVDNMSNLGSMNNEDFERELLLALQGKQSKVNPFGKKIGMSVLTHNDLRHTSDDYSFLMKYNQDTMSGYFILEGFSKGTNGHRFKLYVSIGQALALTNLALNIPLVDRDDMEGQKYLVAPTEMQKLADKLDDLAQSRDLEFYVTQNGYVETENMTFVKPDKETAALRVTGFVSNIRFKRAKAQQATGLTPDMIALIKALKD